MCERSVCVLQKKKTDEEAQTIQHDSALYLVRIVLSCLQELCYKFDLINKLNSLQFVFILTAYRR